MKKFKKIIVGLDRSEIDEILIEKTFRFSGILGVEKIYFVHVSKDLALPKEISSAYPDLMAPVDETIRKEIGDIIHSHTGGKSIDYEIGIKEGNPMDIILRWCKIKDSDLLIMGRKFELEGTGSLAKSIAQKAPCSVLFFTETREINPLKHLMVPLDFSSYSLLTLELAAELANRDQTKISCVHLYEIPVGYSKTGKSYEEFSEIMHKNARSQYEEFQKKHHLPDYPCKFILKDKANEAKYIIEEAKEEGADLILLGSRGRTGSAAILLGSVAEKLVQINNEIPMLIFKKKGENMGFLEALLRI